MIMFYYILWWSCVWLYIVWFDADLSIFSWSVVWVGEFEGSFAFLLNILALSGIL